MERMDLEALNNELLDAVLEKGSLSFVVNRLHQALNKGVLICDCLGRILIGSNSEIEYDIDAYIAKAIDHSEAYYYDQEICQLFFPIGWGKLIAIIIVREVKEEEIENILPVLETANLSLCFYFSKYNAIREVENKYKDLFIQDLLFNNILENEEILAKSKLWGWDFKKEYFVAVIEPDNFINIKTFAEELEYITKKLAKENDIEIITSVRSGTFIVISREKNNQKERVKEMIVEKISRANKYFFEKYDTTFSIGVGHTYLAYKEIYKSYQEAKTALAIARLIGETKFVKYFGTLGIFKLLYKQEAYLLKEYYYETLHKLIDFDKNNNGELLPTLDALISNNMDIKLTAEALFIHVNTLRYRIRKIEEILRIDLSKLENVVNLFVALKIKALLKLHYSDID